MSLVPAYKYTAESIPGNWFQATEWINKTHPEWEVIAWDLTGLNLTVIVRRDVIGDLEAANRSTK